MWYNVLMIETFKDEATGDLYHGRHTARVRRFPPDIVPAALRKLDMLNSAQQLKDLRMPPGNRLEALAGKQQDYHSIRINKQWRLVFNWHGGRVRDVMITDYH